MWVLFSLFILKQEKELWSVQHSLITLALVVFAYFVLPAPGIIASAFVLTLGIFNHDRVLLGLASLFLTIFLIFFYYNLQLNLLYKSFTLMIPGILLLGVRFYIQRNKALAQEKAHA